jgi:hypothetical protein
VSLDDIGIILKEHQSLYVDDIREFGICYPSYLSGDIKENTDNGNILSIYDPGAGAISGRIVEFPCAADVEPLDTVYIDSVSGVLQKCLASNPVHLVKFAGMVLEKPSSEIARFVQTGPIQGFVNLVKGDKYYASNSTAGVITNIYPSDTENVKYVGLALSANVMMVETTRRALIKD